MSSFVLVSSKITTKSSYVSSEGGSNQHGSSRKDFSKGITMCSGLYEGLGLGEVMVHITSRSQPVTAPNRGNWTPNKRFISRSG